MSLKASGLRQAAPSPRPGIRLAAEAGALPGPSGKEPRNEELQRPAPHAPPPCLLHGSCRQISHSRKRLLFKHLLHNRDQPAPTRAFAASFRVPSSVTGALHGHLNDRMRNARKARNAAQSCKDARQTARFLSTPTTWNTSVVVRTTHACRDARGNT